MHHNITAKGYFERLTKVITELNMDEFENAIKLITEAWQNGSQIITMGNGGSSLTALHFINDWNKSVFLSTGKPFYGRSLCDNIGLLTSYANDISYQDVFSEQLKNVLRPKDLVIAISGSGNSENICRAVEYANQHGAVTLGLCGYTGGRLKNLAQHSVWVNVHDMQLCEDIHAIFGHILMQKLCGPQSC
jgi:D-sedoheptulose 7-phosphate isomerase